jgi:amino acid adenylation domain-containing protein
MFTPFARTEIEQTIPQRFEKSVRRHADEVAVRFDGEVMTYRSLDTWSGEIAHAVHRRRGEEEETVALLLGQGFPAVAAILGLLKAGKAYLPIDPWMAPTLRERFLEASGVKLLVSDATTAAGPVGTGLSRDRLLLIDAHRSEPLPGASRVAFAPDRLATVFYTSGTTGDPKGVADCHRNVLHNVMRYTNSLEIDTRDRLSLIQPWSFSGTVSSLFSALLNGASLCLYDLRHNGLNGLAAWVEEQQVTIFHAVPHIFEHLVTPRKDLSSLRIVRLEGDRATPHHIDLFKRYLGQDCVLVNGLGATETGIARQYFVTQQAECPGAVVPVGYATEDMAVTVTDGDGRQLPPGALGEIRVTSRYLALGYWRRPDQTRKAFCADSSDPTLRTYRTGDLGRLREDGCLEYLGRANTTIKLRGQWLETDVTEAALLNQPGIRQARVAVRESGANESGASGLSLVAYLISDGSQRPTVSALRRALGRLLPEQSIPARFVWLQSFPVTANGKVDLASLPPPSAERPLLDRPFKAARDAVEVHLKSVWESLLGVSPVGIQDDFFDLGGDSLLASEMLIQVEAFFGIALTLDTLWLEGTTIEDLAAQLRGQGNADFWNKPAPLQPPGIEPRNRRRLFCAHVESGHLWPYRHLARCFDDDRPVLGLPARGADGSQAADTTVESIAQHCVALMREQQPEGPYHIVGYSSGGIFAYEVARQLEALGAGVGLLALIDTPAPASSLAVSLAYLGRVLTTWHPRALQEKVYQITLDAVGLSNRRRLKTLGESHRWALWRYRPEHHRRHYEGAAVLIRCTGEPSHEPDDWGWGSVIGGPITVHSVTASSHTEIMQAPYVREVADVLRAHADRLDLGAWS